MTNARPTLLTLEEAKAHELPILNDMYEPEFHGPRDEVRLHQCNGGSIRDYPPTSPRQKSLCPACYAKLTPEQVVSEPYDWKPEEDHWVPIPHLSLMYPHEIARAKVGQIRQTLGLVKQDIGHPEQAAEEAMRRNDNVDLGVAAGLQVIVNALIKRGSNAAAAKAISDLSALHLEGDEHPFFTEAHLYELIGKDAARSVLSFVRSATEAVASS